MNIWANDVSSMSKSFLYKMEMIRAQSGEKVTEVNLSDRHELESSVFIPLFLQSTLHVCLGLSNLEGRQPWKLIITAHYC